MNWRIGDRIEGRWEVFQVLKGGMGIVYITYDHDLEFFVALKTFQDELLAKVPQIAERFKQEALAWVALDIHDNVTRAITATEIGLKPHLLLEYISGGNLRSWIGTPRLVSDVGQTIRFAVQFCDGMTHAIQKGLRVHRDIKPENCLITSDLVLKVTDFGLAKVLASGNKNDSVDAAFKGQDESANRNVDHRPLSDRTTGVPDNSDKTNDAVGFFGRLWKKRQERDHLVSLKISADAAPASDSFGLREIDVSVIGPKGTPRYMAPEQFDDSSHVDVRADIYSFGAMLFEMTSGRRPFLGTTFRELENQHKQAEPPRLGCDRRLEELVQACLAKDPSERPENFQSIRSQLSEIYKALTGDPFPSPRTGRDLGAAELVNKSITFLTFGRNQQALECCERALELNPASANAWSNKGLSIYTIDKLKRIDEVMSCFGRALELDPASCMALLNKGNCLIDLGRNEEALACFNRALELKPDDYTAWFMKAAGLAAWGKFSEALHCYDQALLLNPHSAKAWTNKGVVFTSLHRLEDAVACLDRAIEIENDDKAWYNKANLLVEQGRLEDALKCYDQALELNRSLQNAWVNKGSLLHRMKRSKEGLDCCTRALELNPNDKIGWNIKAGILGELGRTEESLSCFEHVVLLDPKGRDGWVKLAFALARLAEHDRALRCWDKALEIKPQDHDACCAKAKSLCALQRWEEALLSIERALELNPQSKYFVREKAIILRYLTLSQEGASSNSLKEAMEVRRLARVALGAGQKLAATLAAAIRNTIIENAANIEKFDERRGELLRLNEWYLILFVISLVIYFMAAQKGWKGDTLNRVVEMTIEEYPWNFGTAQDDSFNVTAESFQRDLPAMLVPVQGRFKQLSTIEDKNKLGEASFDLFLSCFTEVHPASATFLGKGQDSSELKLLGKLCQSFSQACMSGATNAEKIARVI